MTDMEEAMVEVDVEAVIGSAKMLLRANAGEKRTEETKIQTKFFIDKSRREC